MSLVILSCIFFHWMWKLQALSPHTTLECFIAQTIVILQQDWMFSVGSVSMRDEKCQWFAGAMDYNSFHIVNSLNILNSFLTPVSGAPDIWQLWIIWFIINDSSKPEICCWVILQITVTVCCALQICHWPIIWRLLSDSGIPIPQWTHTFKMKGDCNVEPLSWWPIYGSRESDSLHYVLKILSMYSPILPCWIRFSYQIWSCKWSYVFVYQMCAS